MYLHMLEKSYMPLHSKAHKNVKLDETLECDITFQIKHTLSGVLK